ncbi:DUF1552 domain-containing protein [Rubritalea spongiae]|uniref:DUF1552 domain-containing protein n=1 Tax=Rubritalea spongiae TaxID=430797 RepID=A0ABW5E6I1_9BACT
MYISTSKPLSRRTVLKHAGIALTLPMLDAMVPAFAAGPTPAAPKRFVGISLALGLHNPLLIPEGTGRDYQPSHYLKDIQDLREDFTVISGTSHPDVQGGHAAEASIFSACPMKRGSVTNNTISIDQLMAKHLGHHTRFPSLVLNTNNSRSPSYTENGSMIPAISDARKLFAQLFIEDTPSAKKRQEMINAQGKSILDIIRSETKSLSRQLGPGDRDKMDEWLTSVRELETRLESNEVWLDRAKPNVNAKPNLAENNNAPDQMRAMLDVVALALQTDSTRFITLHCTGNNVRALEGVEESYHALSHHGKNPEKLEQLSIVEKTTIDNWGNFLRQLKKHDILDDTMSLLTSNLGNASSHDNRNMPVLFAGGGFKHGQHLAFSSTKNYPLPNLYLSMLQNIGLERESFATSTGTMNGLNFG